jgi:hypothetical protein
VALTGPDRFSEGLGVERLESHSPTGQDLSAEERAEVKRIAKHLLEPVQRLVVVVERRLWVLVTAARPVQPVVRAHP